MTPRKENFPPCGAFAMVCVFLFITTCTPASLLPSTFTAAFTPNANTNANHNHRHANIVGTGLDVLRAPTTQHLMRDTTTGTITDPGTRARARARTSMRQKNDSGDDADDDSIDSLRDEIEQMKKQALQKLNELESRTAETSMSVSSPTATVTPTSESESTSSPTKVIPTPPDLSMDNENDYYEEAMAKRYRDDKERRNNVNDNSSSNDTETETPRQRIAVSNDPTIITTPPPLLDISGSNNNNNRRTKTRSEELLDNTNWKLSLDIGREPGTWMPKDWGVSGERLKLNLEFTLSDDQLFEREEFLGSIGDAKVLRVKGNEMTLAPSITEGQRKIQLLNGGWRVVRGVGPMGTDLLRFYVEVEEEVKRSSSSSSGSDIYCPKGRIYCNCGFFDMRKQMGGTGEKAMFRKRLDGMMNRAEQLDVEIANAGPFSFDGIKKNAELFRLKVDMQRTAESLAAASVAEPDASILRFNPTGDAGLTKEGGVCCKVIKGGMALEYHILGRFYIQSSDK